MTISREASKRLLLAWPEMSKRIIEYVTNVDAPRSWEEKIGLSVDIKDLSEAEQQNLALNILPFMFCGRSKTMLGRCTPDQALRSFMDWKAEGTSVEFYTTSMVSKEQQPQPFVLLIGGSRWDPLQAFAVVEHRAVACPSALAAVDLVFKMTFILDVDYQPYCMAVWQFLESLVYQLGEPVKTASILRFRTWMSQQSVD
ncbi:uncharacterized protein LOC129281750 [Lytechinus pictus]|uniref:uncharacterized protein LOC129281750 n=1 Tax=Lytechinus pictus TaxID=7653 RepID=UPI0030B9E201